MGSFPFFAERQTRDSDATDRPGRWLVQVTEARRSLPSGHAQKCDPCAGAPPAIAPAGGPSDLPCLEQVHYPAWAFPGRPDGTQESRN